MLQVFAHTNFIACIMSAAGLLLSGALSYLQWYGNQWHVPAKELATGELLPSLAVFLEQPMCLLLLIAMNTLLYVTVALSCSIGQRLDPS